MTAIELRGSVTFFDVAAVDAEGRREERLYLGRDSAVEAAHDLFVQGFVGVTVEPVAWDSEEERAILDEADGNGTDLVGPVAAACAAQNIAADARDAREAFAFVRCVVMGRLRGAEVDALAAVAERMRRRVDLLRDEGRGA